MPQDGTKNLIPLNKRSKEEQRKIQAKGGKVAGENKRARKTLREELLALLSEGDTQNKVSLALIEQAMLGNVKAFETIRDSIGEKPIDKVMVSEIDPMVIADVENMVLGDHKIAKILCKDKVTKEVVKSYMSPKDAAKDTGIFVGSITKCLNGKIKSSGGFIWEYEK